MARERDNFVISDVDSFYFGGECGEDDVLTGEDSDQLHLYRSADLSARADSLFQRHPASVGHAMVIN